MSEQERRNFVTEFRLEEYRQWLVTSLANSQEGVIMQPPSTTLWKG